MADADDPRANDHEALADELERTAAELEKRGDEVEQEIAAARSDWESKVADPGVPGAVPPGDGEPAAPEKIPPEAGT